MEYDTCLDDSLDVFDNGRNYLDIDIFVELLANTASLYKRTIYKADSYDNTECKIFMRHFTIWMLYLKMKKEFEGPFKIKYSSFSKEYFKQHFVDWINEYIDCNGI